MSYEDLRKHIDDIAAKALDKGTRELFGTQSPTYIAQQLPILTERCYVDVPALLQPYLQLPDPRAFDSMIAVLKSAMDKLYTGGSVGDPISTNGRYLANPVLEELTGSGSLIGSWTGQAAIAFQQNVIDPFPAVVYNQFVLVAALKAALEAERQLWDQARSNIDQLAEYTISALDHLDQSCTQHDWSVDFTAAAAITGVLAIIPGVNVAAALSITAVGAVFWVTAAEAPQDPPKLTISGGDAFQVLDCLVTQVNRATTMLNACEARIAGALDGLLGTVTGNRDYFVAERPRLADPPNGRPDDPTYLGRPA
jgi:hypothetical protein